MIGWSSFIFIYFIFLRLLLLSDSTRYRGTLKLRVKMSLSTCKNWNFDNQCASRLKQEQKSFKKAFLLFFCFFFEVILYITTLWTATFFFFLPRLHWRPSRFCCCCYFCCVHCLQHELVLDICRNKEASNSESNHRKGTNPRVPMLFCYLLHV